MGVILEKDEIALIGCEPAEPTPAIREEDAGKHRERLLAIKDRAQPNFRGANREEVDELIGLDGHRALVPVKPPCLKLGDLTAVIDKIGAELKAYTSAAPLAPGTFGLHSVAFELSVDAKGNVGCLVAGTAIEVGGKVTVTFTRE
jgi:hypothetical protein